MTFSTWGHTREQAAWEYKQMMRLMDGGMMPPAQASMGSATGAKTVEYRSISDINKIEELKKKLEEKEVKRKEDVKSIIGYFYKNRG